MKDKMNNEGRNLQVTSAMHAGEFKTEPVYLLKIFNVSITVHNSCPSVFFLSYLVYLLSHYRSYLYHIIFLSVSLSIASILFYYIIFSSIRFFSILFCSVLSFTILLSILSFYLSIIYSFYLSTYLPIHYPTIYYLLFVYLSIYLSIYLLSIFHFSFYYLVLSCPVLPDLFWSIYVFVESIFLICLFYYLLSII